MPAARASLSPGDLIGRKYRIDRVIGEGGMGLVVLATHVTLKTQFAVKIILPELSASVSANQRLMEEAQNAGRIPGEHVVRVVDAEVLPDGLSYLAMEFLTGRDLGEEIGERGRIPPSEAVEIVRQACLALGAAHDLSIVHRDIKPSNLFLTTRQDGSRLVKVLDFGISKDTSDLLRGELTSTVATLGSPLYMSPEQIKNPKSVDGRSDLWSLGVVLFESLSGALPFEGETLGGLSVAISTEAPADLSRLAPDVPPALVAVVMRCLEKSRDARFQTAAELQQALRSALTTDAATNAVVSPADHRAAKVAPSPGQVTTAHDMGRTVNDPVPMSTRPSSRPLAAIVTVAATVVAIAGAAFVAGRGASPSTPSPSASASTFPAAPLPPSAAVLPPSAAVPPAASAPGATAEVASARVETAAPAGRPAAVRVEAVAKPLAAPPKADCNPPYVIDSQGHKRFKPECL